MLRPVYCVTEVIRDALPEDCEYPLLPGDSIVQNDDNSWIKIRPGEKVYGFYLSIDQISRLQKISASLLPA